MDTRKDNGHPTPCSKERMVPTGPRYYGPPLESRPPPSARRRIGIWTTLLGTRESWETFVITRSKKGRIVMPSLLTILVKQQSG